MENKKIIIVDAGPADEKILALIKGWKSYPLPDHLRTFTLPKKTLDDAPKL